MFANENRDQSLALGGGRWFWIVLLKFGHAPPSGTSCSSLTLIQFQLIPWTLIRKDEYPSLVGKTTSIIFEYQPNNIPGLRAAASV